MERKAVLEIESLSLAFRRYTGALTQDRLELISDLSLEIRQGEILALLGSSGSGKSLLAHAIMGLLPENAILDARISYQGERVDAKRIKALRGREMALIPQSVAYLDPLMTVGRQVVGADRTPLRRERQQQAFERLGLGPEVERLYPFQLSGGMARRCLFSTAVISDAQLILADEPTPGMALDQAVEALSILRELADEGRAVLLITHDIDLALKIADRISILYAGSNLEEASVRDFEEGPSALRHPYSKALWRALPQHEFKAIPGVQPYAGQLPEGCLFAPRCQHVDAACLRKRPALRELRQGKVRCIHAD